ncbi:hypothetical protein E2C01_029583 [Portunus trituberculatus]|uniref:Uncharacterized protein n=1 Tax=Portunus trituberculatus TaxID=210409 RepID=A0A5B7EUZ1_PORTR|nr:hypothetical protein [Portunus trituberculatus]
MHALGSKGSPSARVRILATVINSREKPTWYKKKKKKVQVERVSHMQELHLPARSPQVTTCMLTQCRTWHHQRQHINSCARKPNLSDTNTQTFKVQVNNWLLKKGCLALVLGSPSPSCRVWERCSTGEEASGAGTGAPTALLKDMVAWYLRRSGRTRDRYPELILLPQGISERRKLFHLCVYS